MEDYLTRGEAAEVLRSSKDTLARWAYQGIGPRYVVTRGKALYRRSDIEAWLATREKAGAA